MATFPALEPYGRGYDFGDFSASEMTAFGGGSMRFSHSDEATTCRLICAGEIAPKGTLVQTLEYAKQDYMWVGACSWEFILRYDHKCVLTAL